MLKPPTDMEMTYLLFGLGASVMASLAKSIKNTKTFTKIGCLKMVAEALSCAVLTLGISMSMHEYWGASLVYSVGIGAFVGSLGNTVIIELLSGLIQSFFVDKLNLFKK